MQFSIPRMVQVKKPEDQLTFNTEVVAAFRALDKSPFLKESVVTVEVDTTATRIVHGLDHTPSWIIVDKDTNADVWRVTGSPVNKQFLYLQASAPVTVKLLMF